MGRQQRPDGTQLPSIRLVPGQVRACTCLKALLGRGGGSLGLVNTLLRSQAFKAGTLETLKGCRVEAGLPQPSPAALRGGSRSGALTCDPPARDYRGRPQRVPTGERRALGAPFSPPRGAGTPPGPCRAVPVAAPRCARQVPPSPRASPSIPAAPSRGLPPPSPWQRLGNALATGPGPPPSLLHPSLGCPPPKKNPCPLLCPPRSPPWGKKTPRGAAQKMS